MCRTVGVMGEINDDAGAEVVFGLLSLQNSAVHYEPVDIEDEDSDMKEVIMVCYFLFFKGSSDQSPFIFEINLGKSRIRHTTTLKWNDEFLDRPRID